MKRLLTLLAFVLCSCAETFVGEEIARPNNENLPDLTATFAEEDNTRTYIEDGKYLRWHEDDRLTAFYGNTLNRQYKFNGATGDNSGTFSLVPDGMLGTGNAFDHIYALYPYNADARISDDGVISLTLPAVQNYAENSFGRGANTMIAVTENLEDTFLAFKNACGYVKLKLYNAEGTTIKSIEVKGNNGERLAGAATVTIAFGEAPVLAMADDATTSVILNCGEGVALGTTAETATEFWVTLPATTFAGGLTIIATDTEGGVFEKSTTNEVIIKRNAIQPMAVLEAKFVATKPANNEIWYTNRSTTYATAPTITDVFGANIISNTYDAAKEYWVIKFDGEVTTIGDNAFWDCKALTSITIPDSVTTIGDYAFGSCSSLTSVTIPDSVTTIRPCAFESCSNLTSVTIPDSVTTIGWLAFRDCSSLTSVTIGDSVTTIGDYAFLGCSSLISVTIPNSVTTIENYAFCGCSSLQEFNGKFASEDGRCLIIDGTLNSFAPAGLTEYAIPDSVTTIGNYAFEYCSSLTSVTIHDRVTSIGESAFENCSNLKKVYCNATIPPSGSYYAFDNNANGRRIYVYEECVEVYKSAWSSYKDSIYTNGQNCPDTTIIEYTTTDGNTITSSKLPIISNSYDNGVGTLVVVGKIALIPNNAFLYCSSLTSVTIPDSVTSIGSSAFYKCSSLTSVNIPDSVTTIGEYAFHGCGSLQEFKGKFASEDGRCLIVDGTLISFAPAGLTEYTIPDSVTTIGNSAFMDCDSLTSVTIPDSVTTIGMYAFDNCHSLTSVTIPDSVTRIEGEGAFSGCSSLTSVYISDISAWCNISFGDPSSNPLSNGCNLYLNNELVTDLTIPDSVTWIGGCAFSGCSSLESVTIGDSVTSIGGRAFVRCRSLTSVTIGDSVTTIGYEAFYNCDSLESVTIGESVTTIRGSAFYSCSSLTSVYCKPTTPPVGDSSMFEFNAEGRKIYVPMGSVEAYMSASYWSSYADAIVGYDFEKGEVVTPEVTGGSYTVVLNNAWRQSTSVSNPNSSFYDGVYESYSNYNVNDGVATMYIDIDGYSEFSIYVRSDAESSYDYVTVSELDSTTQKVSTSGKQNSGTAISNYTKVTYTGIDGGKHRITVIYTKDYSQHSGTDRGYLIIPKNQ